jgi:hypothetical protein
MWAGGVETQPPCRVAGQSHKRGGHGGRVAVCPCAASMGVWSGEVRRGVVGRSFTSMMIAV